MCCSSLSCAMARDIMMARYGSMHQAVLMRAKAPSPDRLGDALQAPQRFLQPRPAPRHSLRARDRARSVPASMSGLESTMLERRAPQRGHVGHRQHHAPLQLGGRRRQGRRGAAAARGAGQGGGGRRVGAPAARLQAARQLAADQRRRGHAQARHCLGCSRHLRTGRACSSARRALMHTAGDLTGARPIPAPAARAPLRPGN